MSLKCQKCSGWRHQSEGGEESGKDDRLALQRVCNEQTGSKKTHILTNVQKTR